MAEIKTSFFPPLRDVVLETTQLMTRPWEWFFREVHSRLNPLGKEETFTLVNAQSTFANITNLVFNKSGVTMAIFEYLVQRVTTSTGAVELTEVGILMFVYNPTTESWSVVVVSEENPDDAGILFAITVDGQVQYTSSNITGTASISTLWYRARTMAGKNKLYSTIGSY